MKLLLLAATAAVAAAKCANDCSSHGECNAKNQCECYRNYFGADCSQRLCPAGRSFIDSALGDINGDNEVGVELVYSSARSSKPISEMFSYHYGASRDSYDVTASWNEAHFYQECSNKGICDTSTGECVCFPGYEGGGCARKSCINDCSGHGACKNYEGTSYNMWDKEATLYCDCDAGYTGPGCEKRVCPAGVDPVQASNLDTSRMYQVKFRSLGPDNFDANKFYTVPFGEVLFTLTVTDQYGDDWITSLMTVNYDVVVNSTGQPTHSFPVLNGATVDTNRQWTETLEDFDNGIPTHYNKFGDGSYHVAEQVKNALESFPGRAAGQVEVHEIYTSPKVTDDSYLLSTQYPNPFTHMDNNDYHLEYAPLCGRNDIYLSAAEIMEQGAATSQRDDFKLAGITGCGIAIVDDQIGSGTCNGRQGNQDTVNFILSTGYYEGATITNYVSDSALIVIGHDPDTSDPDVIIDVTSDGISASTNMYNDSWYLFKDYETIYYQWPHFNYEDDHLTRFPLFENLEQACEDVSGYYSSSSTYYSDLLEFGSTGNMAGLTLFILFQGPYMETSPRADYYFTNNAADAFHTPLFDPANGVTGEVIEARDGAVGLYTSHSLVLIEDVTGDRSWDTSYHGRRAYFLDDGSDTSDGITVHTCSKRGLCDYSTGLCDCFSGFTGNNCDEQNALAF